MVAIKKHTVNDIPLRNKMSYFDHLKKLQAKEGGVSDKQLKQSKNVKYSRISKYDL